MKEQQIQQVREKGTHRIVENLFAHKEEGIGLAGDWMLSVRRERESMDEAMAVGSRRLLRGETLQVGERKWTLTRERDRVSASCNISKTEFFRVHYRSESDRSQSWGEREDIHFLKVLVLTAFFRVSLARSCDTFTISIYVCVRASEWECVRGSGQRQGRRDGKKKNETNKTNKKRAPEFEHSS